MAFAIQEYLSSLRGRRVAVVGIGVSNTPLIKMLLRAGIDVTACDRSGREAFGGLAEELEGMGAKLRLGPAYLRDLNHDVIFRTPGLRPDVPELLRAQAGGSVVTSEMEVFFEACPCTKIAVTGSDGKTTTTTIIAGLLSSAGYNVFLGGNIGRPLLADTPDMKAGDFAVLELSSFQLMTMKKSPNIAVVTNLAPNHLDVHTDMCEYIQAKENIFKHQSSRDKAIFNADNEITRRFAQNAPGQTSLFSRRHALDSGVCVRDGAVWAMDRGRGRRVMALSGILLPGQHNVENYLAAIAATEGLVTDEIIRRYAAAFTGVEHRIELVRTLNGVHYYNDSIASSPSRTIAGLRSFSNKVILIAGGYDKRIPFDELGAEILRHVKILILTGDTAPAIRQAVERARRGAGPQTPILEIDNFERAVLTAHRSAVPGDVVLLSPACAAFDKFKNFAVRGEAFKKIICNLDPRVN